MNKLPLLLLVSLLFSSFNLEAAKNSQPIVFTQLDGRAWVEKSIAQYPEILWLADSTVRKTEEGEAKLGSSYSERLFGQKFVEFDRTLMTLRCLKLILDGSDKAYQEFTAAQPEAAKLTRESFRALHLQGKSLLQSNYQGLTQIEMAQAMETALVLGDMGKSEKARILFKPFGVSAPDHDDFHGEAMHILAAQPELCPSFIALPAPVKALLIKVANLAHFEHVTHLEGGPAMLTTLKESGIVSSDPTAFSFDFFVHTCDVAGVLGHVNNQSSLIYTELTHKAVQATQDACRVLEDPKKSEWDAYDAYVATRATWLGLNPADRNDRVLTRLGAMIRLFTPDEGKTLRAALLKLDQKTRDQISAQLDVQKGEKGGRTPTYIPAVLVNLANNAQLGNTDPQRLSQTVILGLPFVSRVLEKHKQQLVQKRANPEVPLNFNKIAGVAKSAPQSLQQGEFLIDQEGNVTLK